MMLRTSLLFFLITQTSALATCVSGQYKASTTAAVTCSGSCVCDSSSGTNSGEISDGPGNYVNYGQCKWIISSSGIGNISVSFSQFSLDSNGVPGDYLDINKCTSSACTTFERIMQLRGNSTTILESIYTSTSGYMQLVLLSDLQGTSSGFVAAWAVCTDCPANSVSVNSRSSLTDCVCNAGYEGPNGGPCTRSPLASCVSGQYKASTTAAVTCSGSCVCDSSSGTISGEISDGPGNYVNYGQCKWIISSSGIGNISVSFSQFSLDSNGVPGDYLDINKCTSSACTTVERIMQLRGSSTTILESIYTSTSGYMQLVLLSDLQGTSSGFVAAWAVCTDCPANSVSVNSRASLTDCVCNAGYKGPNGGPCLRDICEAGYSYSGRQTANVSCSNAGSGACPCTPSTGTDSGRICPIDCTKYDTIPNTQKYQASSICSWLISSTGGILISFPYFATYDINDGVSVGGRYLFSYSSKINKIYYQNVYQEFNATTQFTSAGNMQLIFQSDSNNQGYGFIAQWSTAVACEACVAGKYKRSLGNENCTHCGSGTYSSTIGLKSLCTTCPPNSGASCIGCSSWTQCTCDAGYWGVNASACTACDAGTVKQSNGFAQRTACVKCGAGTYSSIVGASTCVACALGTVSNQNGTSACKVCETGTTSSPDRTECIICAEGTQATNNGTCQNCSKGYYSNADSNRRCVQCPPGFYSDAPAAKICTSCRACPDGYYRQNCSAIVGGGTCVACGACDDGYVNVGCMNRAGHTNEKGVCRLRKYLSRTPLCDQEQSGFGLGGYTFLRLFGVSQDDSSFQCRRRCDNEQNILSTTVYPDSGTLAELQKQFPNTYADKRTQAFNGGHCSGPYACDVSNCNIAGSADDSQDDYNPLKACPLYIDKQTAQDFWSALAADGAGLQSSVVSVVNAMRETACQTCASCGSGVARVADWGRGCARDCTQLTCKSGFIFDWTEEVQTAKCKKCADLDDIRLCVSSEQGAFAGYDVSGRLPKVYMKDCTPKRQLPLRAYEHSYGSCVQCADLEACVLQDDYYGTCQDASLPTCKPCSHSSGRDPTTSKYWDGGQYRKLYCQQKRCAVLAGVAFTGVNVESTPHRLCNEACASMVCAGDAKVRLPCVLPHQQRCEDSINMDKAVIDVAYAAVRHTPAHVNLLEPATDELHLFASFENSLVSTHAYQLSLRAQCVWNADFIPDNSMNPGGISSRFQSECRPWSRSPRTIYPLLPLQNTVAPDAADESVFARRVLLNTSAQAVAYAAHRSLERPADVFAGDIYLEVNMLSTNNATLAVFVPDDRNIDSAAWVPRWRLSVHARQIIGDTTRLVIAAGSEQMCFACFSLASKQSTSTFYTTNMASATASFRGDKFVFRHSAGLLVCEQQVQARTHEVFMQALYNVSFSELFASSLTDACVSSFGIRTGHVDVPADVLRSSEVLLRGECLFYVFSPTAVYCARRAGGVYQVRWPTQPQANILDVSVYNDFVVRTVQQQDETTKFISFVSSVGSASAVVVKLEGLLMFARGDPRFYLKRTSDYKLQLSKLDAVGNFTFSLNSSSSYAQNDVAVLFSTRVPISMRNTVLEYAHDFVVFATAKYSLAHVFVYVAALDVRSAVLSTYAMPSAVYDIASDKQATRINGAYERMSEAGEATLSAAWLAPDTLLLSVAIENVPTTKFQTVLINVTNLEIIQNTMHPDLLRAFSAPFVRLSNALASSGVLLSCTECQPTATGRNVAGFFAYGASSVSYRRLVACEEANMYVEENMAEKLPIQTCARVVADSAHEYTDALFGYTDAVFEMTLTCATLDSLEVVLEMPVGSTVEFARGEVYYTHDVARVLLYATCNNYEPLHSAKAYKSGTCAQGCVVGLTDGSFKLSRGVRIESVRHRSGMSPASALWNRFVLLQAGVTSNLQSATEVTREAWQKHSVTCRRIVPRQQILIQTQRHVSVETLAANEAGDDDQRIAFDALAVVPVLSEGLVSVLAGNTSRLMTVVYVPSLFDLKMLALEALAYGDDVDDWARVHASVVVAAAPSHLAHCTYAARLLPVDDDLRAIDHATSTGCVLNLAVSPQCHIELPRSLRNAASVVGVEVMPLTSGCELLDDAHDVAVEFAPFMQISQCPAQHFLHADSLTCTPCDEGEPFCGPGQFVSGCLALIYPFTVPQCLQCPLPNHSSFAITSSGCSEWHCLQGFYRLDGACAGCTAQLLLGSTACRNIGGRMRKNCTNVENEKCVDCPQKPRYTQWTISATAECTWQCMPGYFAVAGGCELCLSFDEAVANLAMSGLRGTGAFYRFRSCTASAQATSEKCSARDFGFDLNGTYTADAPAFDEDCVLNCAEDSNLHAVRVNVSRAENTSEFQWRARMCRTCTDAAWPTFVNGTHLPRRAFVMSSSCVSTCLISAGAFATNDTRVCLWCPPAACANGTFWSSSDNCTSCQPCAAARTGGVFTSAGTLDDAHSCSQQCPTGSYILDASTCRLHSTLACSDGLQYAIPGTSSSDAQCGTCADCSGAREKVACNATANRQCESCGAIDAWSSAWSPQGCRLLCRTTEGYTKLYTATGEVCRKCLACPLGRTLPSAPVDCTCAPCPSIPPKASYTKGCMWTCPLFHVATFDRVSAAMQCEYTIKQTSNEVYKLRARSPVACAPGQRLTQQTRLAAYTSLQCEPCALPAGLQLAQLNVTWTWDRACAWQCLWNLQKVSTLGGYTCEHLHYTHLAPARAAAGLSSTQLLLVLVCAVVVLVFALCCLSKMQR